MRAFALLGACALPVTAWGQAIEEVVVTAEKRAQNVQDIPSSISALSADDLNLRGVATMGDLAQQVPGANFGDIAGAPQIASRGIGFGLLTGAGEGAVAVHADGVYLSRPGAVGMLMHDLDRIEFLRGPQGTLYGRNATGGVINLVSPAAPDQFEAGARASVGNHDAYEIGAYIGGPVADGLRARLYVEKDAHSGYVRNTYTGGKVDDFRGAGGRLSLDGDIASNIAFQLRGFYRKEHFKGPIYKPIEAAVLASFPPGSYALAPHEIAADEPYDSDREIMGGSARFDVDLGGVRLVSTTGYVAYRFFEHDYDGDGTALPIFSVARPEKSRSVSQEFNLLHDDGTTSWILGAYYLGQHQTTDFYTQTPGYAVVGILALEDLTAQNDRNFSLFGDLTFQATPQLSLYGGVRSLWERQSIDHTDITRTTYPAPMDVIVSCSPAMAGSGGRLTTERSGATGRAGVKYQLADSSNLYAQYARGYKSGGFGLSSCGDIFEPETLNAFEIGSKNTFWNATLQLNGAAYYYDYHNLQVEQVVVTDLNIANAKRSRVLGLELDAIWLPLDGWQIDANASLMSARYVDFVDADPLTFGPAQQLKGNPLNRAPDWSGNIGAQYTRGLDIGSLTLRADLYVTAKYALRPYGAALDFQPGYTTLGGSLTFRSTDERLQMRAYVKNATDVAYLQGMLNSAGTGRLGAYSAPRIFGLEIGVTY